MSNRPILIMAGGTGGHVFPALAVAQELRAQGAEVMWLGTHQGLEARVVPAAGFPMAWIRVRGLRGKGMLRRLSAPLMLGYAMLQAFFLLLKLRPRAVLGMGGFVTGPGGLMAWLLRRPLLIHEQNSVAGLTNRWLAPLASRVMVAFPGSLPNALQTGNPVRADIAALPEPAQRLKTHGKPFRLLVLGGSLGAQALNTTVPAALARLPEALRPEVWHQTGPRNLADGQQAYAGAGVVARVEPFVNDMAEAYGWADLVICRAGALTIAELSAAGVGALLVPYPHAVDDHQTGNAHYLANQGAAVLVQQCDLTAVRLEQMLQELIEDPARVEAMACKARALAQPDAARRVAQECLLAAGLGWREAA